MGDMYEYDKKSSCSSSTSAPQPQLQLQHQQLPSTSASAPDEISLFLHQILLRSSPSSSSSLMANAVKQGTSNVNPDRTCRSALLQDGISAVESLSGVSAGSGGVFLSNVSTSSLGGASENETDEYDCESEEGLEALVEDVPDKPVYPRGSSKRSRAAEVHNLSEKRRRSRINEKMKALQNLIPNSNKTDKASMLDEAIEYLKQLQLQVQMLSMRNGLSLHPMCLPGALQPIQFSQMRMDFGEEYRPLHLDMTGTNPLNKETPLHDAFTLPNQCTASNQPSVSNMSNIINSETSFGPIQAHLGPFQLHTASEDLCREDILRHQQSIVNHPDTNPVEIDMGAPASVSLPFNTQASNLKDNGSLQTCISGRERSEAVLLRNIEHNLILTPHLSMNTGRSASNDDVKMEK